MSKKTKHNPSIHLNSARQINALHSPKSTAKCRVPMSSPQEPQQSQERATQDTETEEEAPMQEAAKTQESEEQQAAQASDQEEQTVATAEDKAEAPAESVAEKVEEESNAAEAAKDESNKEEQTVAASTEKKVETPAKTATPGAKRTLRTDATSATKRKFDALHACKAAGEKTIYEHEKTKKARASALMKTPGTKPNGAAKKVIKTRDFSFARPTASSASRAAALAAEHAQAKAKPTPPARKVLHSKRTPAKAQRASMPADKTPATTGADKASRAHFSYTPYTGPLPPLTVESSFAPKNSQVLERGQRTASPARVKMAPAGRKSRPASDKKAQPHSSGKENLAENTNGSVATNAASSSKAHRTPVKSSSGPSLSKDKTRSAFYEKAKGQRAEAQNAARSSSAKTSEPTA
ncbi:unnamed protein product [Phytophthora lilii]|uniref:Unnamed protein product n=1 Tax=Phytophthora lilii TaxID=2077276 RepID=A0A9W6TBB3_9STRA|nr:unnamed protein product [Phytophthora lilii]